MRSLDNYVYWQGLMPFIDSDEIIDNAARLRPSVEPRAEDIECLSTVFDDEVVDELVENRRRAKQLDHASGPLEMNVRHLALFPLKSVLSDDGPVSDYLRVARICQPNPLMTTMDMPPRCARARFQRDQALRSLHQKEGGVLGDARALRVHQHLTPIHEGSVLRPQHEILCRTPVFQTGFSRSTLCTGHKYDAWFDDPNPIFAALGVAEGRRLIDAGHVTFHNRGGASGVLTEDPVEATAAAEDDGTETRHRVEDFLRMIKPMNLVEHVMAVYHARHASDIVCALMRLAELYDVYWGDSAYDEAAAVILSVINRVKFHASDGSSGSFTSGGGPAGLVIGARDPEASAPMAYITSLLGEKMAMWTVGGAMVLSMAGLVTWLFRGLFDSNVEKRRGRKTAGVADSLITTTATIRSVRELMREMPKIFGDMVVTTGALLGISVETPLNGTQRLVQDLYNTTEEVSQTLDTGLAELVLDRQRVAVLEAKLQGVSDAILGIRGTEMDHGAKAMMGHVASSLVQLRTRVHNMRNALGVRLRPTVILVAGPPGAGKTRLLNHIAEQLTAAFNLEQRHITLNLAVEHFDMYSANPIVVVEDIGKDLEKELRILHTWIDTAPASMNGDRIEHKTMQFVSEFLLLSTNELDIYGGLAHKDALARRIDFHICASNPARETFFSTAAPGVNPTDKEEASFYKKDFSHLKMLRLPHMARDWRGLCGDPPKVGKVEKIGLGGLVDRVKERHLRYRKEFEEIVDRMPERLKAHSGHHNAPIYLFLGPPGIGKTFLAKKATASKPEALLDDVSYSQQRWDNFRELVKLSEEDGRLIVATANTDAYWKLYNNMEPELQDALDRKVKLFNFSFRSWMGVSYYNRKHLEPEYMAETGVTWDAVVKIETITGAQVPQDVLVADIIDAEASEGDAGAARLLCVPPIPHDCEVSFPVEPKDVAGMSTKTIVSALGSVRATGRITTKSLGIVTARLMPVLNLCKSAEFTDLDSAWLFFNRQKVVSPLDCVARVQFIGATYYVVCIAGAPMQAVKNSGYLSVTTDAEGKQVMIVKTEFITDSAQVATVRRVKELMHEVSGARVLTQSIGAECLLNRTEAELMKHTSFGTILGACFLFGKIGGAVWTMYNSLDRHRPHEEELMFVDEPLETHVRKKKGGYWMTQEQYDAWRRAKYGEDNYTDKAIREARQREEQEYDERERTVVLGRKGARFTADDLSEDPRLWANHSGKMDYGEKLFFNDGSVCKVIIGNLVELTDGICGIGWALRVYGNVFVANQHVWDNTSGLRFPGQTVHKSDCEVKPMTQSDLIMGKLPTKIPAARDIRKHFLPDINQKGLIGSAGVALVRRGDATHYIPFKVETTYKGTVELADKKMLVGGYRMDPTPAVVTMAPYLAGPLRHSAEGDSGSPMVAVLPGGSVYLVGIHSMVGQTTGKMFCAGVCQGMFETYKFNCRDSTANEFGAIEAHEDYIEFGDTWQEVSGLQGVGKLKRQPPLPCESKIWRSALGRDGVTCGKEPAVLSNMDLRKPDSVVAHPDAIIRRNLALFGECAPSLDRALLERVSDSVLELYVEALTNAGARVEKFPFEVAVQSLDMLTSPGLPYSTLTHGGKGAIFQRVPDGEGVKYVVRTDQLGPTFKRRYSAMMGRAQAGQQVFAPFCCHLKDELVSSPKVRDPEKFKTRMIIGAPVDLTVACRVYFGSAYDAIMSVCPETSVAVGMNVYDWKWTEMGHELDELDAVCDFDFKSWDTTVPYDLVKAADDVVSSIYKRMDPAWCEKDDIARVMLGEACRSAIVAGGGSVYRLHKGMVSGRPGTAIINSIAHHIAMYMAILKVAQDDGLELTVPQVVNSTRLFVFGDDGILGADQSFIDHVPLWRIAQNLSRMGLKPTPGRKSGEFEWMPLSEATFLKRKWVRHGPRYLAPLERESILQQIEYTRTRRSHHFFMEPDVLVVPDEDDAAARVNAIVLELAHHDEEFYRETVNRIRRNARDIYLNIPSIPTHREARLLIGAGKNPVSMPGSLVGVGVFGDNRANVVADLQNNLKSTLRIRATNLAEDGDEISEAAFLFHSGGASGGAVGWGNPIYAPQRCIDWGWARASFGRSHHCPNSRDGGLRRNHRLGKRDGSGHAHDVRGGSSWAFHDHDNTAARDRALLSQGGARPKSLDILPSPNLQQLGGGVRRAGDLGSEQLLQRQDRGDVPAARSGPGRDTRGQLHGLPTLHHGREGGGPDDLHPAGRAGDAVALHRGYILEWERRDLSAESPELPEGAIGRRVCSRRPDNDETRGKLRLCLPCPTGVQAGDSDGGHILDGPPEDQRARITPGPDWPKDHIHGGTRQERAGRGGLPLRSGEDGRESLADGIRRWHARKLELLRQGDDHGELNLAPQLDRRDRGLERRPAGGDGCGRSLEATQGAAGLPASTGGDQRGNHGGQQWPGLSAVQPRREQPTNCGPDGGQVHRAGAGEHAAVQGLHGADAIIPADANGGGDLDARECAAGELQAGGADEDRGGVQGASFWGKPSELRRANAGMLTPFRLPATSFGGGAGCRTTVTRGTRNGRAVRDLRRGGAHRGGDGEDVLQRDHDHCESAKRHRLHQRDLASLPGAGAGSDTAHHERRQARRVPRGDWESSSEED